MQAAFGIGAMIRWLDFNDTWLAAEWGHPSDNLGGILATADWLSARPRGRPEAAHDARRAGRDDPHEIQGCLALENSFNAVSRPRAAREGRVDGRRRPVAQLTRDELINAVSNAFVDGHALRTYRHAPNTGSRKSGRPAMQPPARCASR